MLSSAQIPLQVLALDRGHSEVFPKEVLGSVSSAVASVTDNRDRHLHVCLVVGEHLLESVRHACETLAAADFALQ